MIYCMLRYEKNKTKNRNFQQMIWTTLSHAAILLMSLHELISTLFVCFVFIWVLVSFIVCFYCVGTWLHVSFYYVQTWIVFHHKGFFIAIMCCLCIYLSLCFCNALKLAFMLTLINLFSSSSQWICTSSSFLSKSSSSSSTAQDFVDSIFL